MHFYGFRQNIAYRAARGKRRIRVLKYNLHLRAKRAHFFLLIIRDVLALEENLPRRGLMQL